MKKKFSRIISLILSLALISTICIGCKSSKEKQSLKQVKLNEVVRSVFYAPMYVAINEGIFKDHGLDIELSTGQGADKTMQNVLSKTCDIGFCGPEQVVYIYNQKREDYPIIFSQLTNTDGSFLVSRKDEPNFDWKNLKGKTIIGGRPGGMPEMSLEYVLKKHGLIPNKDVKIITNIAFTATAGAFKSGTGDYASLFEPTASMLNKDNAGKIVSSIGKSAGVLPYTCYFATKSYMKNNPEIIKNFTKAIYKAQCWVYDHSDQDVAKAIKSFFPGTDESLLVDVVKNYKSINAYAKTPVLKEADLNRLMDVIQTYKADLIPTRPNFKTIVNTSFAEEAVK